MKHTPGPWGQAHYAKGNIVNIETDRLVANCMGYSTNQDDGEHIKENLANANLIAAAPELLEALIEIAKGEGAYDFNPAQHATNCIENMKELAKEAIIKATE